MNVCAKNTLRLRCHTKMNIRTARYEEWYVNDMNTTAFVRSCTHCPKGNHHTALLSSHCIHSMIARGSGITFLLFTERRWRSACYTASFPQFLLGKLARNRLDGWSASWVGNWLRESLEGIDQCFLLRLAACHTWDWSSSDWYKATHKAQYLACELPLCSLCCALLSWFEWITNTFLHVLFRIFMWKNWNIYL